jgi:hypothetical protein
MSLLEVDQDALQSLLNVLNNYPHDFNRINSAFNTFDGSFMSPDKPQLQQTYLALGSLEIELGKKLGELDRGLQNLQQAVLAAEQVTF